MIPQRTAGILTVVLAAVVGACDTSVVNPGPVTDSFLDNPEAHQALANGAMVQLAEALGAVAYTTGAVTREIFPAGSTSAFGISANQQAGRLLFDDEHVSWTPHQRARNIAETGFARFEESVGGAEVRTYGPALDAALWAGYANRLLGEVFCQAVIDSGPLQPSSVFLERAEEWFTKAIDMAAAQNRSNIGLAALAGRASARANLGKWSEAAADAAGVPDDFVFNMEYTTTERDQYNRIYFASADQPYRAHTVWNTFYEQYYKDTSDPRTPYLETDRDGDAALGILGGERAAWYPQQKHDREDAPIRLSSGWEMRLLEAEALLVGGDWSAALPLINKHRVELGLQPWTANSLEEAWTVYKRERGIELWLEGRRIADLRRWKENNRPGDLHPLETPGHPSSYLSADQTLCYPVPKAEYETNPNLTLP